ncbi:cysteine--tRNA ligase [candidate division WWE3 bacterium RIFCSPHIGHO2_01_FULL_48_15]|uniref:Cysteine--tRNA ligase n=1 Tax=candidate division WWE3 bacterium RIFCSPHIGHO2_01_FULL_48_15 TaxID=1802619 RepID=A0A1F4VAI3_UNCKA|nr:MAG: cysteine--tRNA ligase [candidate division WWE3 bacterium RIFCSPHIGHO2_01_FULL_48_15]
MEIYNSLSRKKEEFKPQDSNRVTLYTCGPTVYGPSHLGHARTYVNFDLLKRALEYNGYTVVHVLNFTDVHDSMIEEAQKYQGGKISIGKLGDRYIDHFYHDLERLNVEPANAYPRVTEHIKEIVKTISDLVKKGYAYEKSGSVYYDVSKFPDYGKLSRIKREEAKTGTRINADKYEREEVGDFALWKKAEPGEEEVGAVWDSPWGKGRPGWHIECSVMSKVHLGETLDIHGGALDLRFPHHENEIAQSEATTGKKFARYWVHAGLLTVEGKKMAKSLGNYFAFDEIEKRGFDPLAFRYLCLTAHYRGELNFTWEAMDGAQRTLDNLYAEVSSWGSPKIGCAEYEEKFKKLINSDLNIPGAVSLLWELIKDERFPTSAKMQTLLKMDQVLGLKIGDVEKVEVPQEILKLVAERERLRGEGNWVASDEVRDQIEQAGFTVEDTEKGSVIKWRK